MRFTSRDRITVGVGAISPLGEQSTLTITLIARPDGGAEAWIVCEQATASGPSTTTHVSRYVDGLKGALRGIPPKVDPTQANRLPIYVFTDPRGPDLERRRRATEAVIECLKPLGLRRVSTAARDEARMWLELVRRVEGEGLTLRLTVPDAGYSTEWSHDSPLNSGMAEEVTNLFAAWLRVNRERLKAGSVVPPAQALQPAGTRPASSSVPVGSSEPLRLFLGPAPAAHGFVNVNAHVGDTYYDLRQSYSKGDPSYRSGLTLVDNRDGADLILEVAFRNDPISRGKRQVRATLTVVGSPLRFDMDGRAGVTGSDWRAQAEGLLRQTVDWVTANRPAIDAVRAARAPQEPAQ